MEENNPYKDHAGLYESIREWFKNDENLPSQQNRYAFTEAKTYYQQLTEINKFLTYFKSVLSTIFANEKEITDGWATFVEKGITASAETGTPVNAEVTGTVLTGMNFHFTIPKGEDGTGIEILDVYETLEELKLAHPTGEPGDCYMVGIDPVYRLYAWSKTDNTWKDCGPIDTQPSETTPLMDGEASVGEERLYARGDHRHPSDTTKLDKRTNDGTKTEVYAYAGDVQGAVQITDTPTAGKIVEYDEVNGNVRTGSAVYDNDAVNKSYLASEGYNKKTLYSDGAHIYEDSAMTTVLTYAQVKAILDTAKYDVQLWNGNYILLPEYVANQTGTPVIYFNGTTELNGNTYMYCIKISSTDYVSSEEHKLINSTNYADSSVAGVVKTGGGLAINPLTGVLSTTVQNVTVDGTTVVDPETGIAKINTSEFGKVKDVQVDGSSVVDSEGIAKIDTSEFGGKIDDVKVNGTSVVTDKVANIAQGTQMYLGDGVEASATINADYLNGKTAQQIIDEAGSANLPIATPTTLGGVKPDGTTITVTDDGTISASGGGSSKLYYHSITFGSDYCEFVFGFTSSNSSKLTIESFYNLFGGKSLNYTGYYKVANSDYCVLSSATLIDTSLYFSVHYLYVASTSIGYTLKIANDNITMSTFDDIVIEL